MSTPSRKPSSRRQLTLKEAKDFARNIIDNPEYRASLLRRAIMGQLPAAVEIRLLEYRYGKPADQLDVNFPAIDPQEDVEELSDEQLAARADRISRQLRERSGLRVVAGTDKVM